MNEEKHQILVIDDDEDYCNLVCELLSPEFDCYTAKSGQEGLDLFFNNSCQPIVALVDLNLPDINGFDICLKLSQSKVDREIAIFIISGDDHTDTKMKAFESGADDYISKPFEIKELLLRIKRSIAYVQDKEKLKHEKDDTKSLANIAMAQASQYSYVMNFFKSLNHCKEHSEIAALFFEAMSFFQLNASLMLSVQEDLYFDSNLADVSPIEKNIYELLKIKGRIYEFGSRLMINGRNVSFLIKNLPEDPNQAGEARDFLAALIEGVEEKMNDLELKSGLMSAVSELNETIASIKNGVVEHNAITSSVMTDMIVDISASYHSLDLNELQEQFFTDLVEKGAKRMSGAETLLKNLQHSLEGLKAKMESIQSESAASTNNLGPSVEDVELF